MEDTESGGQQRQEKRVSQRRKEFSGFSLGTTPLSVGTSQGWARQF